MAIMGRPTKLTPYRLRKAQDYLKAKKTSKEMPLVEELAVYELDVDRHTVARWVKKGSDNEALKAMEPKQAKLYRDFCSTVKKMATLQLMHLKVRGIKDGRNAVAIFLMKADHEMIETTRHLVANDEDKPFRLDVFGDRGQKVVKDE